MKKLSFFAAMLVMGFAVSCQSSTEGTEGADSTQAATETEAAPAVEETPAPEAAEVQTPDSAAAATEATPKG